MKCIKKISFAVYLVCMLMPALKAQYIKIPFDSIHFWDYREDSYKLESVSCQYRLATVKDSLINAKKYHQVCGVQVACNKPSYTIYYKGCHLFRQDTLAKKVWILVNGAEKLIYNFNKIKGDTSLLYDDLSKTIQTYTITNVDSLLLGDGLYHRVFWFNNGSRNIEGVGSLFSLSMPAFINVLEVTSDFVCFKELKPIYKTIYGSDCALDLQLPERYNNHLKISVYPNPASSKITIVLSAASNADARLLNILGEEVLSTKLEEEKTQLDISSLAPGLYYLKIKQGKGTITQKILRE